MESSTRRWRNKAANPASMLEGGNILLQDRIGRLAATFASAEQQSALAQAITALVMEERGGRIVRGALEIDPLTRETRFNGRLLTLPPREYALLLALARADGVLDLATLRLAVLDRTFDPGTNAIAVHLSRLRGKLGRDAVLTVAGGGYRLNVAAISDEHCARGPP